MGYSVSLLLEQDMTKKTPMMSLAVGEKRIEVDPILGVFHAVINGKKQEFDSWKKVRAAVAGAKPSTSGHHTAAGAGKSRRKTVARPGWWISSKRVREGFFLASGRFGLDRRVELVDGGCIAAEDMEFEDIAWLDRTQNPQAQIKARQEAIKSRVEFIQEHEYRTSKGLTSEQALDFLRAAGDGQEKVVEFGQGWERVGGDLLHEDGWKLSAVAHGRTGSFLAWHLRHTHCGEMVVFTKSRQAIEFVDQMKALGQGQGRRCVIFKRNDRALTQLISGKLVYVKGVVNGGGKEWMLTSNGTGSRIEQLPQADEVIVLTDEHASMWQGFADIGWEEWRQDQENLKSVPSNNNVSAQTFDWFDVDVKRRWTDALEKDREKLEKL